MQLESKEYRTSNPATAQRLQFSEHDRLFRSSRPHQVLSEPWRRSIHTSGRSSFM